MSHYNTAALLNFEKAQQQLLSQAQVVTCHETVNIDQALQHILWQNIISPIDVPPFDASAMDGYALRHTNLSPGITLPISQTISAGDPPSSLSSGTAARIFTGAPIPQGADTVIIQENCTANEQHVTFKEIEARHSNLRKQGCHIKQAQTILKRGARLNAAALGLLASLGMEKVDVFRPLNVGVLSTGDELTNPGSKNKPGQIFNSNHTMLKALLTSMHCNVINLGTLPDDLTQIRSQLKAAQDNCDVIISSGGMSVGDKDYVHTILNELGEVSFYKLNIKPGKPVAHAKLGKTDFLGLPGNPVSCFVTFYLLAQPFILKRQGLTHFHLQPHSAIAGFSRETAQTRTEFLRVSVKIQSDGQYVATPHPKQDSATLLSIYQSDGLLQIPANTAVKPGDTFLYHAFHHGQP